MIRDLVEKSRSYRGYDESRQVTREELVELVECARLTPSSVNMQPLKYFLAWQPEVVKTIQPLTKWARALQPMELPHPGHCPTAFIVICQDTALQPSLARFQKDVGIVAQTMLLAAVEKGLGGFMIGNRPLQLFCRQSAAQRFDRQVRDIRNDPITAPVTQGTHALFNIHRPRINNQAVLVCLFNIRLIREKAERMNSVRTERGCIPDRVFINFFNIRGLHGIEETGLHAGIN